MTTEKKKLKRDQKDLKTIIKNQLKRRKRNSDSKNSLLQDISTKGLENMLYKYEKKKTQKQKNLQKKESTKKNKLIHILDSDQAQAQQHKKRKKAQQDKTKKQEQHDKKRQQALKEVIERTEQALVAQKKRKQEENKKKKQEENKKKKQEKNIQNSTAEKKMKQDDKQKKQEDKASQKLKKNQLVYLKIPPMGKFKKTGGRKYIVNDVLENNMYKITTFYKDWNTRKNVYQNYTLTTHRKAIATTYKQLKESLPFSNKNPTFHTEDGSMISKDGYSYYITKKYKRDYTQTKFKIVEYSALYGFLLKGIIDGKEIELRVRKNNLKLTPPERREDIDGNIYYV